MFSARIRAPPSRAFHPSIQRSFHHLLSPRTSLTCARHGRTDRITRTASSLPPSSYLGQRHLHTSPTLLLPAAPKSKDRGPKSEEETQTDFNAMNILSNTPPPTTAIDACLDNGFALNSGLRITGAGVLLYSGEAFKWRPWENTTAHTVPATEEESRTSDTSQRSSTRALRNAKGQWEVSRQAWGLLDLAWPRPDLIIIGTGKMLVPLSPAVRADLVSLGVRVEVQDSRNAAAQFNLLATERGTQQVAAALLPVGWV